MSHPVEILSRSMQGGLVAFFLLFAALAVYIVLRHQDRRASLLDHMNEEYLSRYQDLAPHSTSAPLRRPILPALWRAYWISLLAGVAIFLTLAFTPLSYFRNFSKSASDQLEKVELRTLRTDFQTDPMEIEGELANITSDVLPKVQAHLILYDVNSATVGTRAIDVAAELAPEQTAAFLFFEPKSDLIKRVGVTFSSQSQPLIHREAAALKQP